jgi:cyclohexanecarboxyl-CoA dehydrogenase
MTMAADVAVVFARTAQDPGAHGVSAFLVPLDLPGVSRTRLNDLGSIVVGRGSIFFDGAAVPEEYRLGEEGKGFVQVMQGFDFSRALIGLQCLAPAQASLEETWAYVQERRAFNHPLVRFEGVSFPLAEAETQVQAARLLCYRALWLKDRGEPHTAEAAMCKWWAPLVAYEAIQQCLLLHGHAGYSKDLPHQQRLRDVLGLQIGDGTAQIMKLIIARERAGRAAVPY